MFDLAKLEHLDRGLANMAVLRDELTDRISETQSVLTFGRLLPDQARPAPDAAGTVVPFAKRGCPNG